MIAMSGLACGVAVGTKPVLFIYAVVLCVVALAVLLAEPRHGDSRGLLALVIVGAILATSVFWLCRAVVATGNPLYPLEVRLLGTTVLPGLKSTEIIQTNDYGTNFVRSQAEWLVCPWVEYNRNGPNYSIGSGFGAVFATFVPLGLIFGLYSLIRNRDRRHQVATLAYLDRFLGIVPRLVDFDARSAEICTSTSASKLYPFDPSS